MKQDYFIIDGKKIIIIMNRLTDTQEYYKEENGVLVKLTKEEDKLVKSLFKRKNPHILNSEKLTSILRSNNNIGNNEVVVTILEWIENIIPENARENFYRNVSTLRIEIGTEELESSKKKNGKFKATGEYDIRANIIRIPTSTIEDMYRYYEGLENKEEIIDQDLTHLLVHELFHMASSHYDPETDIRISGFDTFPAKSKSDENLGLTEGLTEALTFLATPKISQFTSGYYLEGVFLTQLSLIIDFNTILSSYFKNEGITKIEAELNSIIPDKNMSYYLFRQIENNFLFRNYDIKTELVNTIQTTLIKYFFAKLEKEMTNQTKTKEELINMIDLYESKLITEDIIKSNGRNIESYLNVNESLEEFQKQKESFISRIKENKI